MKVAAPAGSPPFLAPFAEQLNRVLNGPLDGPAQVYAVDAAADLARLPPKDNRERMVFVRSIARLAVSNGTAWLRTDTGAAL